MATTNLDLKIEDLRLSPNLKGLPVIAKYDEALKELLAQVFAGSVILAPTDRAFDLFIGQSKESLKFPFISLFPSGGYTHVNQNYALSNIGKAVHRAALIRDDDTLQLTGRNKAMQNFYQVMYYDIPYAITCWSTNRLEALQLVQELCFWLQAQGEVIINYKENKYTANVTVSDNISDDTAYTAYSDLGNIYQFTITVTINAPVFRTQNYLNITRAELELTLKDETDEGGN